MAASDGQLGLVLARGAQRRVLARRRRRRVARRPAGVAVGVEAQRQRVQPDVGRHGAGHSGVARECTGEPLGVGRGALGTALPPSARAPLRAPPPPPAPHVQVAALAYATNDFSPQGQKLRRQLARRRAAERRAAERQRAAEAAARFEAAERERVVAKQAKQEVAAAARAARERDAARGRATAAAAAEAARRAREPPPVGLALRVSASAEVLLRLWVEDPAGASPPRRPLSSRGGGRPESRARLDVEALVFTAGSPGAYAAEAWPGSLPGVKLHAGSAQKYL